MVDGEAVSDGEKGVPAGITTACPEVGTPIGLQFEAVDQLVLTVPFHVLTWTTVSACVGSLPSNDAFAVIVKVPAAESR